MKLIFTVGISCSGKSTWSTVEKQRLEAEGKTCQIINRDDKRHYILTDRKSAGYNINKHQTNIWNVWKFGKDEQLVSELCDLSLASAVASKVDVIICSDTNLVRSRLSAKIDEIKSMYSFDEIVIREFPISLEDASKRDHARADGVGDEVLFRQWLNWHTYKNSYVYVPKPDTPKAIMVDIDGTLSKMFNRKPYEWDKVEQDLCNTEIVDMVRGYFMQGYYVVVMSGRDSVCRNKTISWLNANNIPFNELFMRAENDNRKDTIVKEELFINNVKDKFNVKAVIDDRPSVTKMWKRIGLNLVHVGNPWESF